MLGGIVPSGVLGTGTGTGDKNSGGESPEVFVNNGLIVVNKLLEE